MIHCPADCACVSPTPRFKGEFLFAATPAAASSSTPTCVIRPPATTSQVIVIDWSTSRVIVIHGSTCTSWSSSRTENTSQITFAIDWFDHGPSLRCLSPTSFFVTKKPFCFLLSCFDYGLGQWETWFLTTYSSIKTNKKQTKKNNWSCRLLCCSFSDSTNALINIYFHGHSWQNVWSCVCVYSIRIMYRMWIVFTCVIAVKTGRGYKERKALRLYSAVSVSV